MTQNLNRLVVLVLGLIAPLLVVVTRLSWGSITPDPLPTHWSGATVNGVTGASALFGWTLGISAVLAVLSATIRYQRRSPEAGRLLVAILTGGAWQVGAIYVLSMSLSRHVARAQSVRLPWYALLVSVLVPVAVGVLVWFLVPAGRVVRPAFPSSPLRLGELERVTWISRAHSNPLRLAAAASTVAAAVLLFFAVVPGLIAFAVAVLLAWTSEVAVRIDPAGVHTLWGPVGWPRQVIHLDGIAEAHAAQISPMQWGGWGYRITSNGTAANVRSGPGIVVQRTTGRTYVVTVDGAAEGADVLNALLVRSGGRS